MGSSESVVPVSLGSDVAVGTELSSVIDVSSVLELIGPSGGSDAVVAVDGSVVSFESVVSGSLSDVVGEGSVVVGQLGPTQGTVGNVVSSELVGDGSIVVGQLGPKQGTVGNVVSSSSTTNSFSP